MSHLLSNYCPSSSVKQSLPPIVTAAQSSVNYAMFPHPTVSKAHLPLVNQAVQSHPPVVCQAAHSPLISEGVQSRPPIVCQEVRSPLVNQAVQSRPPIVCQDEARSPLISEGVQSRPPVLSQLQLPAQATITPSSVQTPFQQAITKEQMNFALSTSNQGLFTNGCFMNCTFQINVGQNSQKRTKRPRVIYSDSDED